MLTVPVGEELVLNPVLAAEAQAHGRSPGFVDVPTSVEAGESIELSIECRI